MKDILESLEISEEVKTELSESFDKAVLAETLKIVESKEADYEDYMFAQLTEMKSDLETKLDDYLERVVEEFMSENEIAIEESINKEKYDSILEGFNSVIVAAGVEIAQIAEAKEEVDAEELAEKQELQESEKIDSLMEELLSLKATNAELLKTGLVKESMEDMSSMQKEQFTKLASVLDFDAKNPQSFIGKLDTLAESVTSSKQTQKIEESVQKPLVESKSKSALELSKHLY